MIRFILNEKEQATGLTPGLLLLDYVRYHRHLMGTKIGCREGDCGACAVLIGELNEGKMVYRSATSCLTPLANVAGKHVVTVEGLNGTGLNPIQQAMSDEAATQCGFCTPGFVVSLAGFCLSNAAPTQENVVASINGNICRCTGYKSIERAAGRVVQMMSGKGEQDAVEYVTGNGLLPAYFRSIAERLKALPTNGQTGSSPGLRRFLGGGTDLYVQQPEKMVQAQLEPLVTQNRMKQIYQQGNSCVVGAAATVTDMLNTPILQNHFPQLAKFIKLVSSTPIRNIATVGGNLVNASPIGDLTIFFLALNAQLVLADGENERVVPLNKFYKGYNQLNKAADEFVKAVSFQLPDPSSYFNFEKVSKRTHLDIASVNSAMYMETTGKTITIVYLSAGGVAPVPLYLHTTSAFLHGKELSEETVLEAVDTAQAEVSPISDVRGSEAYKRLLLAQLIKAHFLSSFTHLSTEKLLRHA